MGYSYEREPTDWTRVARGLAVIACVALVLGAIYGVIYYKNLPSPAEVAAKDAAARFYFLQDRRASDDGLCAAAAEAKSAYTNVQDAAGYRKWRLNASIYCANAELNRRLALPAY